MTKLDFDFARHRRETIRWIMLLALNNSRPIRAAEKLLLDVVADSFTDTSQQEIRRELMFIEGMNLVDVTRHPSGKWFAELTAQGVNVIEYSVECPIGIARPEKYW